MESEGQKNRLAFSKKRLEALPIPATGRSMYHDTATPGLTLRVSAAGGKVFCLYRWTNGKPVKLKLGGFPDLSVEQARRLARTNTGKQADGEDLAAERRKARRVVTLTMLFEHWRDTYAKLHKRTWQDDERQFRKYLGEFHSRRLDTLRSSEIAAWHGRIAEDHGPVQANRTLALLSTLFNSADKVGYTGRNPCDGVKRFREQSRDRFLLPHEMRAFFDALALEPDPWRDFFLLALFTGARRGNVAAMAWGDIDLERRVWRIPLAKNNKPQFVVLVGPALEILKGRHELVGNSPWVFPATKGDSGHVVEPKRAWDRVIARAGIENLRVHDLRRSLGSWEAAAGTALQIIGASLGHRDLRSTQVYSRLTLEPVREAVEKATTAMIAAANGGQDHAEEKQE